MGVFELLRAGVWTTCLRLAGKCSASSLRSFFKTVRAILYCSVRIAELVVAVACYIAEHTGVVCNILSPFLPRLPALFRMRGALCGSAVMRCLVGSTLGRVCSSRCLVVVANPADTIVMVVMMGMILGMVVMMGMIVVMVMMMAMPMRMLVIILKSMMWVFCSLHVPP